MCIFFLPLILSLFEQCLLKQKLWLILLIKFVFFYGSSAFGIESKIFSLLSVTAFFSWKLCTCRFYIRSVMHLINYLKIFGCTLWHVGCGISLGSHTWGPNTCPHSGRNELSLNHWTTEASPCDAFKLIFVSSMR